jgi:hypothetical protein
LLCSERFFSTGHHATITAIRWESAYNGFHGDFSNYLVPAALIGINTFASFIVGTLCLPFLLLWPRTRGRILHTFEKETHEEENPRGEFVLCEDPEQLRHPLFKLFLQFFLFVAVKVDGSKFSLLSHPHFSLFSSADEHDVRRTASPTPDGVENIRTTLCIRGSMFHCYQRCVLIGVLRCGQGRLGTQSMD